MLRRTALMHHIFQMNRVSQPPASGYEISELPDEATLQLFLDHFKEKLVVAIVHNGLNPAAQHVLSLQHDPVTTHFVTQLSNYNFGNPTEVKFALVPVQRARKFVEEHRILAVPTSVVLHNNKLIERTVGHRHRELATKCLFFLRNNGKNIFSTF